jgi:hypothetical protein
LRKRLHIGDHIGPVSGIGQGQAHRGTWHHWCAGPTKVAAIALANKIARMAWAMMAKGERYKEPAALRRERDCAGHPA